MSSSSKFINAVRDLVNKQGISITVPVNSRAEAQEVIKVLSEVVDNALPDVSWNNNNMFYSADFSKFQHYIEVHVGSRLIQEGVTVGGNVILWSNHTAMGYLEIPYE